MVMERVPLTDMNSGESGVVVDIMGGEGLQKRLRSLGIRLGSKLTKISSGLGRGPVVVKIDSSQTAFGHGMSYKLIVEVER